MSKKLLAYALGERFISGNDVESVHLDGLASPIALSEAEAMGAEVRRVVWIDESATLNVGREMVRYADMSLGSREKAEAKGLSVKRMSKHMRAEIDREHAARAADDAAFTARKQRLGPKAATVDMPQSSASSPSPEPEQPLSPYAAAILSLDEARVRPRAAAFLVNHYREKSSRPSLEEAEAILAALPIEERSNIKDHSTMAYSFTSHADAATEKVIARSVEIRALGLSQKGARGDDAAKAEARRLNAALADYRSGTPIGKALHSAGADVAAISDATKRALNAA